jgi:hypothetical protein
LSGSKKQGYVGTSSDFPCFFLVCSGGSCIQGILGLVFVYHKVHQSARVLPIFKVEFTYKKSVLRTKSRRWRQQRRQATPKAGRRQQSRQAGANKAGAGANKASKQAPTKQARAPTKQAGRHQQSRKAGTNKAGVGTNKAEAGANKAGARAGNEVRAR